MNVTCDKCNKRYSIADDKVRGKSVKIRCKQCQNLISVQGPASGAVAAVASAPAPASMGVELGGNPAVGGSPWEEERTRAMPAMDVSSQWFAMVKGKQLGPLDLKGLEGKVKTGELTLRTYLWRQGMGDWKRASDVPEVSPVFAGVSVGATATAAPQQPISKRVPAVQRDVAVALETPSPEITAKKSNGNGNGNGNGSHAQAYPAPEPTAPVPAAEPAPAPAPAARAKVASQAKAPAVARPVAPEPAPLPDALPTAPIPGGTPAPLSDLFDSGESHAPDQGPLGTLDGDANDGGQAEDPNAHHDPFAALGPVDPSQVPAPGEATKFFIAQAGVHKRNPPWKIALFVLGGPGLIVGTLYLLSSLHIVPLEVTRTNEKGEEVKESFFSAGGVSGIKDIFSGEAAKKKADAEKAKLAIAEKRKREAIAARANDPDKPDKADPGEKDKPTQKTPSEALALIYGNPTEKGDRGPRVRPEDREKAQAKDTSGGLSQEASQKVIADRLKAFEDCVAQALRRNPNLAVGPIDVVLNVAASGVVTSATISPAKHNNTDWGTCMREVGKKIMFPKSDGDTEVSLPLKVGVAL